MLSDPYLTHQLIPYIGNKRKLLTLLQSAISATGLRDGTFCDLFAGSGVVSRLAKRMGFRVIANDWEPYSDYINSAYVATNTPPAFAQLGGMESAFASLNALDPVRGYIARHYCPEDDECPDYERERMFYTQENGQRIDAMREQIAIWHDESLIDPQEEAVLVAPLIYQASYCSNTSGVFKGFHRGWGGATKTAWYRIRSRLALTPPILFDNGHENLIFRQDAADIAENIESDIAYIDPPYNQHQYGSNYHLLNTVALWDKPPVTVHIAPEVKSAIRLDWRTSRRSPYCSRATAVKSFSSLVARIRARFVLVSYSTDGIMPLESLLETLAKRGALSVVTRRYKRYRVSSQRPSEKPHTTEFVAIVDTSARSEPGTAARVAEEIHQAGTIVERKY